MAIYIPSHVISRATNLTDDERDMVEKAKEKEEIDSIILAALEAHGRRFSGLEASFTETKRAEKLGEIRDTLDVAIALVALCSNIDELERLKNLAHFVGRKYNKPVKVNEQQLRPRLKAVFAEISNADERRTSGNNDKDLLRRKVIAALTVINESLSNKRTSVI